jgi:hypothetical protein
MTERILTNYRRGVDNDNLRHASNPAISHKGLCGAELTHLIGLFQIGHPLSCGACTRLIDPKRKMA